MASERILSIYSLWRFDPKNLQDRRRKIDIAGW